MFLCFILLIYVLFHLGIMNHTTKTNTISDHRSFKIPVLILVRVNTKTNAGIKMAFNLMN